MSKRVMATASVFTLILVLALTQAALAAPKELHTNSKNGSKTVKKTSSSQHGGGHTPVEICHKGHLTITVDDNALPAHLNHGDTEGSCSEGGGEEPTTPEEPGPTPEEPPEVNPTEPEEGVSGEEEENKQQSSSVGDQSCDGKSIELRAEEKSTLDLHNKTRKEQGLEPLCVDPTLEKAARSHSENLIRDGSSDQKSNGNNSVDARLKRLGYDSGASEENVAKARGYEGSTKETFKRWMQNPKDKENILNAKFHKIGVGVASEDFKKNGKKHKEIAYAVNFGG